MDTLAIIDTQVHQHQLYSSQ